MGRAELFHRLPKLPAVNAKPDAYSLLQAARKIATDLRAQQPQAFYSIREVASHFGVATRTVCSIYEKLEQEGLLRRIRGSKTILEGTSGDKQLRVRGFIALPCCVGWFATRQYYRKFFLRLKRELINNGFLASLSFWENEEELWAELSTLAKKKLDTVIWFEPSRAIDRFAPALRDKGLALIAVTDESFHPAFTKYHLRRDTAIIEALESWRCADIDQVLLVQSRKPQSDDIPAEAAVRQVDVEHDVLKWSCGSSASDFLQKLKKAPHKGVIFASAAPVAEFGCRCPQELFELLAAKRVLLVKGPVNTPFCKPHDVLIDLILIDYQLLAEQIVHDLSKVRTAMSGTKTFEATYLPKVPLSRYAQHLD